MISEFIEKYLERIGCRQESPGKDYLFRLQRAHLHSIPFENVDIYYGIPIDLLASYQKVVLNRRGGFCYELNGLFFQLLTGLGFSVRMVSARVFNKEGVAGPEFDHMALIVRLDEYYLVDVGFGDFSIEPLLLQMNIELNDPAGIFRFQKEGDFVIVTRRIAENRFSPEYIFSYVERKLDDFLEMCTYHQTSPDSHFTKGLVCTIPTENGRITMTEKYVKVSSNGVVEKSEVQDVDAALSKYFRLTVLERKRKNSMLST